MYTFSDKKVENLEYYSADASVSPYNSPGFSIAKAHFAAYFEHAKIHNKPQNSEINVLMNDSRNLSLHFSELEQLINRRLVADTNQQTLNELTSKIGTWKTSFIEKIKKMRLPDSPYACRQRQQLQIQASQRIEQFIDFINRLENPSAIQIRDLLHPVDLSFTTPSLGRMITDLEIQVVDFSKKMARHVSKTPLLNFLQEDLAITTLSNLKKSYELQGYSLQGQLLRSGYHPYDQAIFERLTPKETNEYEYIFPKNNPKKAERMVFTTYDLPNYQDFSVPFYYSYLVFKLLICPVELVITLLRLIINGLLILLKSICVFFPNSHQWFNELVKKINQLHEHYSPLSGLQKRENALQVKHWESKLQNHAEKNKIIDILKESQVQNCLFKLCQNLTPSFTAKHHEPERQTYETFKVSLCQRTFEAPVALQSQKIRYNPQNHFVSPFEILSEIVWKIDNDGINVLFRKAPLPAAVYFAFCLSGFSAVVAPSLMIPLAQSSISIINAFNQSFCGEIASNQIGNMAIACFLTWSTSVSGLNTLTGWMQEQYEGAVDEIHNPLVPLLAFTSLVFIGNMLAMVHLPTTLTFGSYQVNNYISLPLNALFNEIKTCQEGTMPFSLVTESVMTLKFLLLIKNLLTASHSLHHRADIQPNDSDSSDSNFLTNALNALASNDKWLYYHLSDKKFARKFYQELSQALIKEPNIDSSRLTEAFYSAYCQEKSYNLWNLLTCWLFILYGIMWLLHALMGHSMNAHQWQKLTYQKTLMCIELIMSFAHMLAEFFKCLIDYVLINALRLVLALCASPFIGYEAYAHSTKMRATHAYDSWKSFDEMLQTLHLHRWTPHFFWPIQVLMAHLAFFAATTNDIAPIAEESMKHFSRKS